MADYSPQCEAAIVRALKADAADTALIAKASVYGQTVPQSPAWPFSRIGSLVIGPFRASGLNASRVRANVQCFAKDRTDGLGTVLLPASMAVGQIAAAVVGVLDDATLSLGNGVNLRLTWVQTLPSIDGDEPSAWKASCIFQGEVAG